MEKKGKSTQTAEAVQLGELKVSQETPTCVQEVMTAQVTTLQPTNTLNDAIAMMANNTFRHFIVVEPDSRLAGVISDRDLLRAMNQRQNWDETKVGDFMTREVVTVSKETHLSDAADKILNHHFHCLPVVDEKNRVCGIVTSTDLLRVYEKIQKQIE